MARREESNIKTQFSALGRDAHLELFLPQSSDFDAAAVLRDGSLGKLSRSPPRRNLYFDEEASLTLVLETSIDEEHLRTLLTSLVIVLAAHATDAVPQGSGNAASASGKHDLMSTTIPCSEFSAVLRAGEYTFAIWNPSLHLRRPRARLQRPAIYFTAHLTISAEVLKSTKERQRDHLESFESLPSNLLEPLHFDPTLSESNVYFSESRIMKVAPPTTRTHDDVKPIRSTSKRAFPVVPALFTRIRYSTLPDAVIASLQLETSQLVSGTLSIREVSLEIENVDVSALSPLEELTETRAGDEIVLLYKLTRSLNTAMHPELWIASVRVTGSISLDYESSTELDVSWQAKLDMSQTGLKPTYRWSSRPLSSSGQQVGRLSVGNADRPPSSDSNQKSSTGETGITLNFTATPTTIRNEEFKVDVQCINRSSRVRRFAIVTLQPKRAAPSREEETSEDMSVIAKIFNTPDVEPQVFADVLDLSPDVRIGPLPPGASYETQMKFRAMTAGVLDLGTIRIVDLDSRLTVDVRELPDVIAFESD